MKNLKNFMSNLPVKVKIISMAILIIFISVNVGLTGTMSVRSLELKTEEMVDNTIRRNILANVLMTNGTTMECYLDEMNIFNTEDGTVSERSEEFYELYHEYHDLFVEALDEYEQNFENDETISDERRAVMEAHCATLRESVEKIDKLAEENYKNTILGDEDDTVQEYIGELGLIVDEGVDPQLEELVSIAEEESAEERDRISHEAVVTLATILILLIAATVIGLVIAFVIANVIQKSLNKLAEASDSLANGNFNVSIRSNRTDEIGRLSNNFANLVEKFINISSDMQDAFCEMNGGNLDARVDSSHYNGTYKAIAEDINVMLENTGNELYSIIESVNSYANGDFSYNVPRFPGKKAVLHEAMDTMKVQLENINETMSDVISSVSNGNLDVDINSEGFNGDWNSLILKLAELVETVAKPVRATSNALSEISSANFDIKVDEDSFKGEFKNMAMDINNTASVLSKYIDEISNVLVKMANQDLDVYIEHEYIGDFSAIKTSLELIIENFNMLIKEIVSSSQQVAIGSQNIADSATNLAQGATEQASAVEELTATISIVSEKTKKNMENTVMSNDLAAKAKINAELVRDEMQNLLVAMEEINKTSHNISNIINAIDDIAFQTNILALNASVEAARAGEHGKGFAVVAEEVRSLAARSQTSAKETAELVSDSLDKVEHGNSIVSRTAETVETIAASIDEISAISVGIANDSREQTSSISEINVGINQIAEVVSSNTAASEESAAASQELASQSAVFKEMVSRFNLRQN